MPLKLSERRFFAPQTFTKLFPDYPHTHEMSVKDVSEQLGVSHHYLDMMFRGEKPWYAIQLTRVSNILSVPLEIVVLRLAQIPVKSFKKVQEAYEKELNIKVWDLKTGSITEQYRKEVK
jgi:hypothetical protein